MHIDIIQVVPQVSTFGLASALPTWLCVTLPWGDSGLMLTYRPPSYIVLVCSVGGSLYSRWSMVYMETKHRTCNSSVAVNTIDHPTCLKKSLSGTAVKQDTSRQPIRKSSHVCDWLGLWGGIQIQHSIPRSATWLELTFHMPDSGGTLLNSSHDGVCAELISRIR